MTTKPATDSDTPQDDDAAPVQGRLTAKTRKACKLVALHGYTQKDAARAAGMDPASLSRALKQDHVAAYLNEQRKKAPGHLVQLRQSAEIVAIETAIDLMKGDAPPSVKQKLVELFSGERKGGAAAAVQINNIPTNTGGSGHSGYSYKRPASPTTDGQSVTNQRQPIEIEGKATDA